MTAESRLTNSARNILVAWFGLLFYILANFATRAVFARWLDANYLGMQSLFTNVLTILSLAELGVGSAISYALYTPIAHDDKTKIIALMQLFRKAYISIGLIVLVLGACLTPFIDYLISDPHALEDIPNLRLYFYLFVLNTGISYFFSYKAVLITAYQKEYLVSLVQYASLALMSLLQIVVLLITQSYLIFLLVMVVSTLLQNLIIALIANRMYPFLRHGSKEKLDRETLTDIKKNVCALVLHRIGGIATTPLSSVFMSKFVSLATAGIYGNYIIIEAAIERIFDRFFWAIIPSAGNLVAQESSDEAHRIFLTSFFINGVVYCVACAGYFCSVNYLIPLWVGSQYLFPQTTIMLASILMFAYGMRSAVQSFTSAYGLYWHSRYKPIVEFISFCITGIAFGLTYGVNGIIIAGIISKLAIATPYEVYVLYKHGFKRSSLVFWKRYISYTLLSLVVVLVSYLIGQYCAVEGMQGFILNACLATLFSCMFFMLVFWKSTECAHTRELFMRILRACLSKLAFLRK